MKTSYPTRIRCHLKLISTCLVTLNIHWCNCKFKCLQLRTLDLKGYTLSNITFSLQSRLLLVLLQKDKEISSTRKYRTNLEPRGNCCLHCLGINFAWVKFSHIEILMHHLMTTVCHVCLYNRTLPYTNHIIIKVANVARTIYFKKLYWAAWKINLNQLVFLSESPAYLTNWLLWPATLPFWTVILFYNAL